MVEARPPVLEIIERFQSPACRDTLKEGGGGLVGCDAGRSQKPDHTRGLHERHRALHEKRIDVYVAAGEEREIAGTPGYAHGRFSVGIRSGKVLRQRIIGRFERGNHSCAIGSPRCHRNLSSSRGEPLHLLKFHAIPRRIADNRIKAAVKMIGFPLRPNARETDLPIHEPFFASQLLRLGEQN